MGIRDIILIAIIIVGSVPLYVLVLRPIMKAISNKFENHKKDKGDIE